MRIAIFGRILKEEHHNFVQNLFDYLQLQGHSILVEAEYFNHILPLINIDADYCQQCFLHDNLPTDVDFVFSLGGDGTLLNSIMLVKDSQIPVMGINIGRLGFLTSSNKHEIAEAITMLEKERYKIDKRALLKFGCNQPLFGQFNYALNEFTIHKLDTSAMISIHTYVNGIFLNSYWADGLIVSTPTGSTGYSLSCGGPIIAPRTGNFVLTPVAPHNLNVRPIVLPDSVEITFEVEGRSDEFSCTLDSRYRNFNPKHKIKITKEKFALNLIRLEGHSFMRTLREKLMWGADSRINSK
ncbi:UNVERIFIED_CONTAM: hypothetical protein GTU68_002859 [Idotea baltica]|nr:hypothetical protein [Idotea baltica]